MKKTYIAILVASLMTVGGGVNAETLSYNDNDSGKFGITSDRSGNGDSLVINGNYKYGIVGQNNDVTVKDWSSISISLTNETIGQADVVGVIARKGKTTVVNTSGDLSITASGTAKEGTDPIPVHAYGGTIEIYAGGNIKLLSSDGNAIMSQPTVNDGGKFSSSVSLTAGGDIVIESDGAAILAGLIQEGLSDKSSSVTINAANVSITSKKGVAVKIYDQDQTWNPNDPRSGNAFVELHADKKLALNGATYGIDQVRNGAESTIGSTSKFSAGEEIVINGDSAGIRATNNKEGIHSPNNLNIYAPKINVTGASSAAVIADSGANIQFAGDEKGTTKTNVTLSGNQDAVQTVETSTVGFTNAAVDVIKGNINSNGKSESNGKLELNNSNVIMHGGNFKANTLTGTGTSSITLNDAKSTVSVSDNQSKNLSVTAGSTLNDTFNSVEEAAAALKNVTNITNNNQKGGSYSFAGQSGALSDTWTADNDGNITSRTTNQSLDAFDNYNAMTLVQWRNEVNHISQRLGDVRDSSTTIGAWARVYGYDSSYDDNVSIDFKANSIQAGGDYRINNTWLVGGAFSYTDGEGKFSNGSADSDGYSLAAYLSGFFDCGAYVDFVGRIGRLSTDITAYSDASEFKGSYNNTTFGLSAEVGYHWKLNDTFYVEPQAELAYGFVKGDDFTGANDVRVEQDDFQTLVGRLGARIGASFADGAGTVYAHASVNHDFLGDADYTASLGSVSRDLSVDIGGTWVSYGIGAQFNTTKNLNFYGTLERANGSEYQEDYRYSVGMSYRF